VTNGELIQGTLFEHRFWLQIMGDHARFLLNALSSVENAHIGKADSFIRSFDTLLEAARRSDGGELQELTRQALTQTMALREFKLDLLRWSLLGKVKIAFTPTFLNHMVNELEEYLRILQALAAGQTVPVYDPLHHDLLWLPDASGHAAAIAADLDMVEKRLIKKSKQFEKHFNEFYLKAIEMVGYIRTNLREFPALRRFHLDIDVEMNLFVTFLRELEEMEISAEVLDRIPPLIPDHMMREECYYLTKLALSGWVPDPKCDPTRPRIEA
jgi:hypothetical protein